MLDLLVTHASLPDGRQDMSVAVQDGRIVEVTAGPGPQGAPPHETLDAQGLLLAPPFCRRALPHGRDAQLRPAARQRKRHAARRHRAVGRAQAAAEGRGADRARHDLLRLGGGQGPAGDPLARRRLRPEPAGGRGAAGGEEARGAVPRPAAGRLSAGRRAAQRGRRREPEARAGHGRRRRRRHSAFRAHHGRRRRQREAAVRARRRARPAGRHALRRIGRSAVAPHRNPGLRGAAPRPAGPRDRLATARRCTRWTTTT